MQVRLDTVNRVLRENLTGIRVIRAFDRLRKENERFRDANQDLTSTAITVNKIMGVIQPFMMLMMNATTISIVWFGGVRIAQNNMQIGDMMAFLQYAMQIMFAIIMVTIMFVLIPRAEASAIRINEVLDLQTEIVGPTGAGKTTLVNLLMRFYEIQGGRITVDGVDIRDLKRSDLRRLCGMVLQDTWLFNGTIRENIAYGREDATEEEIVAAAEAAHAHHFIMTLPEGYDTILNEEASNISQGQKQLLTIARAILADPVILILDEATSNVDTRTEVLIQRAMDRLMEGRTSFVIAHRLSTIRDAELILVMDHGTIIEQGTHQGLLEQNGFYADLYNSQFSGRDQNGADAES